MWRDNRDCGHSMSRLDKVFFFRKIAKVKKGITASMLKRGFHQTRMFDKLSTGVLLSGNMRQLLGRNRRFSNNLIGLVVALNTLCTCAAQNIFNIHAV